MDQPTLPQQPGGTLRGLDSAEAGRRLAQYGANEVAEAKRHPLRQLLGKLWGPVPWMLEATILLELFLERPREAAIIAALLLFNGAVSYFEESRADKALALLRHRLAVKVRVFRDGIWISLPARSLVPGDVVHLRVGDLAPADVKLSDGALQLDQSALTGESVPVEAIPGTTAYAGSVVRRGEASGEVVATGARTRFGRTAELVRQAHSRSHLQGVILAIVKWLIVLDAMLACAFLAYAAVAGLPLADSAPFALMLLVASVPVALPAMFTLATALGASELAHSGVLVTHLAAIEEAAGMDVLCTDKTGTITENRLALSALHAFAPGKEDELLRLAALACDPATQDPIDLAILAAAEGKGLRATSMARLGFVPFDPAQRYAEGRYAAPGGVLRVVKGAASAVAALAAPVPGMAETVEALAGRGYRVLAVAAGSETALEVVGLVALEDPPRADSASLIDGLRGLGIRVLMVTGDNLATAREVARRVGLGDRAAEPDAIAHLDGEDALDYDVFARVFPEHKFRLIDHLQRAGHVVGMTGDGVNDAPALKQADMGIAVASATDVARAAAGVVLTQPGLIDALAAVRISRRIYQRMLTYTLNKIVKTLQIVVFLSLGAILAHALVIRPRLIVLLLFANDFVTMSIATDRVSFSAKPDRWNIRSLMLTGIALAVPMMLLAFGVFFAGRDLLGLPLPQIQTLVFLMLVMTGQGNVYLLRERGAFWRSRPGGWLIASSLADLAAVSVMAARGVLMAPVGPALIAWLFAAVLLFLLLADQVKLAIFRRFGLRGAPA